MIDSETDSGVGAAVEAGAGAGAEAASHSRGSQTTRREDLGAHSAQSPDRSVHFLGDLQIHPSI